MRVVRRSASLALAASLSGDLRVGAGQIRADALYNSAGGSPQAVLTNSLTRHWHNVADATGVAYRGYATDYLRIAKGLSGRGQHREFAGSPSYSATNILALAQVTRTSSASAKNHADIVRASSSTTSASVRPEDARTWNE